MSLIFGIAWSIAFYPLIGLATFIAWCGVGLLAMWAYCRFCHRRDRKRVPTEAALGALADAVTCHWCKPGPKGPCTCGVACGHELCPRLSRADLAYTDHGAEMPR